MSNITPTEGPDGNSIEGFSQRACARLNDDDVEERTDLAASRVLRDHDGALQRREASIRFTIEKEQKSGQSNLDTKMKEDRKNARRNQAANRKPASFEDEEKRKKLDEESKAASSEAVSERKSKEALKLHLKTQKIIQK